MKNSPVVLSAVLLFCFLSLSVAASEKRSEWEFGFAGGLGTGALMNLDIFGSGHDDWRAYNTATGLLQIAYHSSPRVRFRLSLGLEYLFNEREFDGIFDNHLSPIGELAGVFHFLKDPKSFDPYLVAGVGFPTLPHVGLGGQFKIKDRSAVFVEMIGSSMAVHNRFDVRAGVKWLI